VPPLAGRCPAGTAELGRWTLKRTARA
jgi:hypothetical protein